MATRRSTSGSTGPSRPLGCGRRRRSSTDGADLPIWGFDGSSTNQAPGSNSDCVLKPVFSCPDPIRGGDNMLVMSEVLLPDMTPHPTNTRALLSADRREVRERRAAVRHRAGVHVLQGRPPARLPRRGGFPAPQGFYYCGIGADEVFGRDVVEAHLDACLDAGLGISGINAEVMPGQWEFQVGPLSPARRLRPAVDGALAAVPHRRGLRHRGDARPEAGEGRLERRRRAHELLDEGDARGVRADHHGVRGARRRRRPSTSRTTAPRSSTGSPVCTRPRRGTSSATASPTAARRCASRGRSRSTRRATSRTVARTPTWTRTS